MEIMPNGRHVENKNSSFIMPQDKDTMRTVQPELPASRLQYFCMLISQHESHSSIVREKGEGDVKPLG